MPSDNFSEFWEAWENTVEASVKMYGEKLDQGSWNPPYERAQDRFNHRCDQLEEALNKLIDARISATIERLKLIAPTTAGMVE